ncbi:MAG: type II secretion system F family protein [Verrucomicrobia bacterium]|jgi:type IV pilus assembly protein PilC|nr:type II secretion system F family protein [Verrucomicrobiota bacterium]
MTTFLYTGMDHGGRKVRGRLAAADESSLEARLQEMGLWLVEARPEHAARRRLTGRRMAKGGSRRELINFCILMSFQLKVGIPMMTALQVAAEDCENPGFRQILEQVKDQVEAGAALHEALARHSVFSRQFTSLVQSGERSGTLPESFMELRRYLEWQEQILADVRQATIYPAIVLFVVCLFVMILFTFVVPRFVSLLTAANVPLPLPTRVVFGISGFAKATWWMWVLLLVGVPGAVGLGRRLSPGFAVGFDKARFRLPLFGELIHMLVMSRFAQNLAVMYRAGIGIVEALKLTTGLVGSVWVARVIQDVAARLETGETMSEAMRHHPVFPSLLQRMVVMGERTGNLDKALENVSEYYNLVVPRKIKRIFSVAEPALILFLVVIVGFVALAIFLPILGMIGTIK